MSEPTAIVASLHGRAVLGTAVEQRQGMVVADTEVRVGGAVSKQVHVVPTSPAPRVAVLTPAGQEHAVPAPERPREVHVAGLRGRPGPRGEPGPAGGAAVLRTAGATISALRAVYERDGLVYPLDYRDEDSVSLLLGIALTTADPGGEVTVQRSGALTDSSWTWSYGPLWLGAAGAITQTPPDDGFDVAVGVATAATSILLDIQPPIALE